MFKIGAPHERLDAFVRVAEPGFEPDNGLAIRVEAEMPRLDNAGVNRADRDLVQAFAFGRQKCVRLRLHVRRLRAKRMARTPLPVIQPRPRIRRVLGLKPEEIADRALQTDRGRMLLRDGKEAPVRTSKAYDTHLGSGFVQKRHVNGCGVTPKPR